MLRIFGHSKGRRKRTKKKKREETKEEVKRVIRKECRELRNHLSVGQHIKFSAPWIFTMYCSQAL
jgi:hypothetical protein